MHNFFSSLSDDEKALLSHVCMQYMDRTYDEHGVSKDWMRYWDRGMERVEHDVCINGVDMKIQGFAKRHPEFYTGTEKDNAVMAYESLSFMGHIAHYYPKDAAREAREMMSHPSFGTMDVGRHSGSFSLFDHPVREQHAISLSVSDADMYLPHPQDPDSKISISGGRQLVEIKLSDSQYVRMIRGEFMEVPCTISRSFGYMNDEPNNRFMQPVKLRKDVETKIDELMVDINADLKKLCDELAEGKLTSKKKLAALIDLVDEIEQQWEPLYEQFKTLRTDSVQKVREVFIQRLAEQVNQDLKKLPANDQQLLLDMLGDI